MQSLDIGAFPKPFLLSMCNILIFVLVSFMRVSRVKEEISVPTGKTEIEKKEKENKTKKSSLVENSLPLMCNPFV